MNEPMPSVTPAAPAAPAATRSRFVTVLAWAAIVIGGVGIPISLISAMMVAVHSYGTNSTTFLGFVQVVLGPPATLVAGIALLRRKRWAWAYMVCLLGAVALGTSYSACTAPKESYTYTSPSGVPTTVLASDTSGAWPIVAVCAALLAKLLTKRVRDELGVGM